jgi:hypothetical protein
MDAGAASDEVTDAIASIELHRQVLEAESGLEAARNFALRKLQELMQREQQAARTQDPGTANVASHVATHLANIEAVKTALDKIKGSGGNSNPRATLKATRGPRPRDSSGREIRRPASARVRRNIGRGGGR